MNYSYDYEDVGYVRGDLAFFCPIDDKITRDAIVNSLCRMILREFNMRDISSEDVE